MHSITLPRSRHFRASSKALRGVPAEFVHWAPSSWDGVPSEPFTAIEQICHVRDIEIEGYQVRFRRTLDENSPLLPSIDSEAVAKERDYGAADATQVFAEFRAARAKTLSMLRGLDDAQFARPAVFEGYGPVTLARAGPLPVQPRPAAPVGPAVVVRQDRRARAWRMKRSRMFAAVAGLCCSRLVARGLELVSRHGRARARSAPA